jgi:hypothetical protein
VDTVDCIVMRLRAASCSTRRVVAIGMALYLSTRAATANAAELPGAHLSVARSAGAETCPDADVLALELSPRLARESAPMLPLDLSVDVARDGDAFVAAIHVQGRKHGERLLRAEGPSCDALHDALVVTLLVVLDEERTATTTGTSAALPAATIPTTNATATVPAPVAPEAPPRASPAEPAASAPQQAEKPHPLPLSLWLSAGGGATHGVPLGWSGMLLSDLAVRLGIFELSAGAFWAPQRTIPVSLGEVTVGVWGARARGCYAFSPEHTRGTRLLGCATGMLGALSGQASPAFVDLQSATKAWWLAGGSLEATYPLSPRINVGISVAALATLNPQTFSVKGLPQGKNPVFDAAAVIGIAAARLEARLF